MPDRSTPLSEPGIVAALRGAGCVFAEDEARVLLSAARDPRELASMVQRRVAGLPLEQVVGWAEFCGLRVIVEPGVFVPRRRTEFLVSEAVATLRAVDRDRVTVQRRVVDLCCGSGAVGAAILAAAERVELHAADVDPAAVACARRNLSALGGHVHEGDLFDALPITLLGRIDVLVVNAPYVPSGQISSMPAEAREHEPLVALDGGHDGLDVQRRVAADAARWLAPGGHLLIETSALQAARTVELLERGGLGARVVRSEGLDATVAKAARLSPRARPNDQGVAP